MFIDCYCKQNADEFSWKKEDIEELDKVKVLLAADGNSIHHLNANILTNHSDL